MQQPFSTLSSLLNGIAWLTLLSLVWTAARAFGRIDDSVTKAMDNHLPHIQDSLAKLEIKQDAVAQELRGLRDDIRNLR